MAAKVRDDVLQLAAARWEAEDATRARDHFLAMMSPSADDDDGDFARQRFEQGNPVQLGQLDIDKRCVDAPRSSAIARH